MVQLRWYILESWKKITENITITDGVTNKTRSTVYFKELKKNYCKCHCYYNAPTELKMIFCRWYIIFTDGYTE
jgi:hypothetical protein